MNYLRLHSDNGFGDPAHATDGYILIWDQPSFTESQTAGEVGAAADAETPTTFPFRSCMELISGALCMVNKSLSTKLAINIASAPPRTAEGTVRLETP